MSGESPGAAAMQSLSTKAIRIYSGSMKLKFIGALEIGDCICAVYHLQVLEPSTIKIRIEGELLNEKTWCAE